jgi:hypothetical protein
MGNECTNSFPKPQQVSKIEKPREGTRAKTEHNSRRTKKPLFSSSNLLLVLLDVLGCIFIDEIQEGV